MPIVLASLFCVGFGFIALAVLASLRLRIGHYRYQTGVLLAVFLIVLNAAVFVFAAVASIFEGASS